MKYYFNKRTYRSWVEDKDLLSFRVKLGESDLFIRAARPLYSEARQCLRCQRRLIQDYIRKNPEFGTSLAPYSIKDRAPDIVREMAKACSCAGVGPMAAVAGAVAEYVGKDLLRYSSEVIVENGGDIFMRTNRIRKVGIFAGKSAYTAKLALEIAPEGILGICTSSATVGPSLSFGKADAAVVISNSAILADAWATRLGNMVKTADDIEKTLNFVKDKPEIKGTVIIVGDKIGVWGDIKIVKC
ncbi:MAG: UPF0280 family protein [Candidatus Omnitrophica bacterium]|nr:UPF0280 family protein [Candidatus Omnitrophota bacterium]MBU3934013.1 UPF0280 family protein [Candidatus Omnitrophota bacterium]